MKLLVLTPEPIDADMLRSVLGEDAEGAEVLVVSPATNQSKLAFWVSDPDEAIAEAEAAQEETVERLEEAGIDAAGDTGESEPALALQDALATFAADRIVIFSHPDGDLDYREDEGLADAEARFGVPSRTPSSAADGQVAQRTNLSLSSLSGTGRVAGRWQPPPRRDADEARPPPPPRTLACAWRRRLAGELGLCESGARGTPSRRAARRAGGRRLAARAHRARSLTTALSAPQRG
jgi:hypothetical protein